MTNDEEFFFFFLADDEANFVQAKSQPKMVGRFTKHLLGRTVEHPWVKRNAHFFTTPLVSDARGTAGQQLGSVSLSATELVSWLLIEAKEAARHHTKVSIEDAVITVPPFWTHWERAALLEAAQMAGLNVLSLVNEGTACAMDYYLTRTIGNETSGYVVLFDMGHVSTRAYLLQFLREPGDGKGKQDVINAVVVDAAWDDSLGGRNFDENLLNHLIELASKKTGLDIASLPKAVEKLRVEAQRVKEILSANTDIEARVEGLVDEVSFATKVTRADFEVLNANLLASMLGPVKALLEANDLTHANITEVEVVGGGVRVPKVRETLAAFFERPSVDMHLNGDDCGCVGAAFYAAMKSSAFRKQPFKFRDISLFPVSVSHPAIGDEPAGESKALFPFQNKLFSKKVLSFNTTEPVSLRLRYDTDAAHAPRRLPPGTPRDLVKVEVEAPTLDRYQLPEGVAPRISVGLRLTSSGTVAIESVEAEFQAWETPATKKKKKTTTTTTTATTTSDATTAPADAASTTEEPTDEAEAAPQPVLVNKVITVAHKETWLGVRSYTAEELGAMKSHTAKMIEEETAVAQHDEVLNELESFIYTSRERLTDDDMERHATETEREALLGKISAASEWMENNDMEQEPTKVIRLRLAELRDDFKKLERRAKMFVQVPEAVSKCKRLLAEQLVGLANLTTTHDVNSTDVSAAQSAIQETMQWLDEKEKEFRSQPENQDPVITPTEVHYRCDGVRLKVRKVIVGARLKSNKNDSTAKEQKQEEPSEPEEKAAEDADRQQQEEEVN